MATKKKELLEQEAPVTETVMSEGETLPADTAQPESLPADTGNSLDLNELLGQMDQPLEDTSAEDMAEDPLPELTEEEMFGDTPAETDDQSAAPTDMPEDFDVQPPDVYEDNADAVQEPPASPKPKRTIVKNRNNDNTPWIRNLQSHPSTTFHKICIDNNIFILKPFSHKTASKIFIHTLLFFDGNLLDQDLRHFFRDLSIFCHFIIWACDTYHTNNLIGYDNGIVHPFKTSLISIMRMDDQFLQPVVNDPLCSFMLLTDTLLISTGDNNPFFIHHINFVIDDRVQFLYDYLSIMSRKLHIILPPQVVCISLRNSLCEFFKFSLQSPRSCAGTDFGSLLT